MIDRPTNRFVGNEILAIISIGHVGLKIKWVWDCVWIYVDVSMTCFISADLMLYMCPGFFYADPVFLEILVYLKTKFTLPYSELYGAD